MVILIKCSTHRHDPDEYFDQEDSKEPQWNDNEPRNMWSSNLPYLDGINWMHGSRLWCRDGSNWIYGALQTLLCAAGLTIEKEKTYN